MSDFIKNLVGVLFAAGRLLLGFLAEAVGLLSSAAQIGRDDDQPGDAMRGGVLNYRTGKLDDGTDPYGWYERD